MSQEVELKDVHPEGDELAGGHGDDDGGGGDAVPSVTNSAAAVPVRLKKEKSTDAFLPSSASANAIIANEAATDALLSEAVVDDIVEKIFEMVNFANCTLFALAVSSTIEYMFGHRHESAKTAIAHWLYTLCLFVIAYGITMLQYSMKSVESLAKEMKVEIGNSGNANMEIEELNRKISEMNVDDEADTRWSIAWKVSLAICRCSCLSVCYSLTHTHSLSLSLSNYRPIAFVSLIQQKTKNISF